MAMSKKLKVVLWVMGGIVALIVIVVALVILNLNTLVKRGVEMGGQEMLEVKTEVAGVDLSLRKEYIKLQGLKVANPQGFNAPAFATLGLISVSTNVRALRQNEIHIREVLIENPEFALEYANGQLNVKVLLDRLNSKMPSEKAPAPKKEGEEPILLKVDRFRMTNAKATFWFNGKNVGDVGLGELTLPPIADDQGRGVPPEKVVAVILQKLLHVEGIGTTFAGLSGQAKEEMAKLQEQLGQAKDQASAMGQQGTETLEKIKEEGVKSIESLKGEAEKAKEGLKDIFKKK